MAAELDGPRLEPRCGAGAATRRVPPRLRRRRQRPHRHRPRWQPLLPDAAFVSPHAPEPCAQAPSGRQWFGLTFRDPDERWLGVARRRRRSNASSMPNSPATTAAAALALVGFSQGTMMALHAGLRRAARRRRSSAIRACSCCRRMPSRRGRARSSPPPVLLVHGDQDDLIPAQALFHAHAGLGRAEVPVRVAHSAGVGHGIDQEGLRHGGEFLARRLALRHGLARAGAADDCAPVRFGRFTIRSCCL